MTSVSARAPGRAQVQGERWGAAASDWAAVQEGQCRVLFETAWRRLAVGPGTTVLDVGSGAARTRAAVTDALAPYRTTAGGVRLENRFWYLVTSVEEPL